MPTTHPIKSSIEAGSVYYYSDPSLKSTYPHYCIVVNIDPSKEGVIFLVHASHRINKVRERRKGCPKETLVEISPLQYSEFNKKSIIDCNEVLERDIDVIASKFDQRKLEIKPVMGLRLVRILRKGLIVSNQISPHIKSLLKE
ncbi:MAG: hypothetical protein JW732_02835 [Dehalococcoidia bacterium]|nr:hypothetical protein [Dehalococcoidia bacterium]